ncbi:MAG: LysR family transcriptional regulator [Granulosicoccus sp.]
MNSNELNWQDIRLFLAVADGGSFSEAARVLKLGQPTLSRRIAELEEQLGQPLFTRLSQGCELTTFGAKLLPAAEQMALWSAEAMMQIQAPDKYEGRVCITAPPAVAFIFLPPFAAELKQRFPDIQLEVRSDIATLNLARGEAHLSLRIAEPENDDLICLASFYGNVKAYVSEALASGLSEQDQRSIHGMDWICWPDDYDYLETNQVLKREIPNFKPSFTSNDYNVQLAACCAGLGALPLPEGVEKVSVLKGLITLPVDLNKYTAGQLHMVVHKRQRHVQRVIKVAELLEDYLASVWKVKHKIQDK